eukprot:scaffold308356_cov32-Tisochrysis_lutea.AAC.1
MEPVGEGEASVSFRQVGKQSGGQLRRGHVAGAHSGGRKFASIPSKFETTLYTGAKPKEGFGSSAHRFTDVENDLPGPGTYDSANITLRDDKIYSKKGLGVGFVSKDRRKGIITPKPGPGPGNYEEKRTLTREVAARTHVSHGGASSAFKPPSRRVMAFANDQQPGPGQYGSAAVPGTFEAQQAAFRRAQSMRQADVRNRSTPLLPTPKRVIPVGSTRTPLPAPGQYEPKLPSEMSNPERALASAAFRSTVPVAGAERRSRLTLEQHLGIVPRTEATTPGPGQYIRDDATSVATQKVRNTPAFSESKLDRFGRPLPGTSRVHTGPQQTPGPGQYYTQPKRETAPISSAVFMSGTSRVKDPSITGVPGPAYYKPEMATLSRKSHHLNVNQRWLPAT